LHSKVTRLQKHLKSNTYFCIHFRKVSKVLISFCREMYISWEIYFWVPRHEFWSLPNSVFCYCRHKCRATAGWTGYIPRLLNRGAFCTFSKVVV